MCDTWVALGDVTASGHVILAKNSDRPIFDCQPLVFQPRTNWPAGSALALEYVTIPQAETTYATLGSSPYWCWGYEEGINEHRVAIGNEAIYTRTFRASAAAYRAGEAPPFGLLGMDLVRLGLERARSAAEAVAVMGELVERYGQFGSAVPGKGHAEGGYDNSFIVADPSEAWVFEALGVRWVARRVTRGSASISNQVSTRTAYDAGSADLAEHARRQGWWPLGPESPFDVARAYIDETVPRQISHIRAARSRQLLAERHGAITPAWMMRIARDHYEGTFLEGPTFDAADPDFLSVCMHVSPAGFTWGNTASSCVVELTPAPGAPPVFWWTPGPPCLGCYAPFFVPGGAPPPLVSQAGTAGKRVVAPHQAPIDAWAPGSYWWMFRALTDAVKGDPVGSLPGYYPARSRLVRERFDRLEQEFAAETPEVLARYTASGDPQVLSGFTTRCVERVAAALEGLLGEFAHFHARR
ncbi:MAG TPA: C69 family dipeptidase [Roseiflexaceae bacterium]|nr:C69 family dipeptidase [Roseiflexaceae bacterium]